MKNRMITPIVSLAALIAASVPAASHAGDNPAVDRCVQMFVEKVVPADYSAEIRHEDIVASIRPISATRSQVRLVARGEKYAKLFGLASCVVDRNGSLVAMYLYDRRPGQVGYGRPRVIARNIDATQGSRTAFADDTKPF